MTEADRGRLTLNAYSRCLIATKRKQVETILRQYPVLDPDLDEIRALIVSKCLGTGKLRVSAELYSGFLYLAMMRDDYSGPADIPPLTSIPYGEGLDLTNPNIQHYVATRQFADCVVMAAPQPAARLLFAREASPKEDQAFSALAPYLGPCINEGQTFKLARIALTGLLAEAMYRAIHAPAAPAGQGNPVP